MTTTTDNVVFLSKPEFCPFCGAVFPVLRGSGNVTCYVCSNTYPVTFFSKDRMIYDIHFNSVDILEKNIEDKKQNKEKEEEGPIVERKCPKCGNGRMSYAALQLRSADEGQTIFFTCTKCKYKESENS